MRIYDVFIYRFEIMLASDFYNERSVFSIPNTVQHRLHVWLPYRDPPRVPPPPTPAHRDEMPKCEPV